jgi:NMD protein affecting ribosome stability and mRNA decay
MGVPGRRKAPQERAGRKEFMSTYLAESRKDRLIHEHVHDPYKTTRKPAEPTVCPICRAVFKGGRWQWLETWPTDAHQEMCQACQRTRDNYPAGLVTISGSSARTHREEILNLVRNQETSERAMHPLHRIIRVEEHPDAITVSTTDIHLPKRIGEAMHRAFKGQLDVRYDKETCFVRVNWSFPE